MANPCTDCASKATKDTRVSIPMCEDIFISPRLRQQENECEHAAGGTYRGKLGFRPWESVSRTYRLIRETPMRSCQDLFQRSSTQLCALFGTRVWWLLAHKKGFTAQEKLFVTLVLEEVLPLVSYTCGEPDRAVDLPTHGNSSSQTKQRRSVIGVLAGEYLGICGIIQYSGVLPVPVGYSSPFAYLMELVKRSTSPHSLHVPRLDASGAAFLYL